ncbi:SH3 domain-containing protein [Synechococcus moorigangaii CMS01]|nr:SH3 domain-containing protein [Synechococcus moorigangaii CMS01]
MNISNLFQFIFGFILGVFFLLLGSVGAAYYFFNRMAASPPKPVFSTETVAIPEAPAESPDQDESPAQEPTSTATATPEETTAEAEPKTEASDLPDGAYAATVTWSSGLSLRSEPSQDSSRLGGIDYNAQVTVIGTSEDGSWQQIRLENGTEAWVKAGNLARVN